MARPRFLLFQIIPAGIALAAGLPPLLEGGGHFFDEVGVLGGEVVFEISCDSGRYDLDLFQGYELGVRGTTLRAASMATASWRCSCARAVMERAMPSRIFPSRRR